MNDTATETPAAETWTSPVRNQAAWFHAYTVISSLQESVREVAVPADSLADGAVDALVAVYRNIRATAADLLESEYSQRLLAGTVDPDLIGSSVHALHAACAVLAAWLNSIHSTPIHLARTSAAPKLARLEQSQLDAKLEARNRAGATTGSYI